MTNQVNHATAAASTVNTKAEERILAHVLVTTPKERAHKLVDRLSLDLFSNAQHQRILRAMQRLVAEEKDIDEATIHGVIPDGPDRLSIVKQAQAIAEAETDGAKFEDLLAELRALADKRAQQEAEGGQAEMIVGCSDPLVMQYGHPLFFERKQVSGFNERYFAGKLHSEGHLLFEPGERSFYRYQPRTGLWGTVTEDALRETLARLILDYGRVHGVKLESKLKSTSINGVIAALKGIAEEPGAFNKPKDFVHVRNGIIRLDGDGYLFDGLFSPEDRSRNRAPVEFHPDADCPRFLESLLEPALPADDIDLLQRWLGLVLTGSNPAQRIMVMDGEAGTGKSTIVQVIRLLIGASNVTQLRTNQLADRFETFRFLGKTLLTGIDVPADFLNQRGASTLKGIVGGDPLDAEGKRLNSCFPMLGNFNVIVTSNSRLRVRLEGDVGAWRRRLMILRFAMDPPKVRIPSFGQKLIDEEGSGILRWALTGLRRARAELRERGDLVLTKEQKERVEGLLTESDSLRQFVRECLLPAEGADCTTSEIVEGYFAFCCRQGWTPQGGSIVEKKLPDLILEAFRITKRNDISRYGKDQRGYSNLAISTIATPRNP